MQISSARDLQRGLEDAGKHLVPLTEGNPVDAVWGAERPAPPQAQLRVHASQHAGESVPDKLQRMRKALHGARPAQAQLRHAPPASTCGRARKAGGLLVAVCRLLSAQARQTCCW